MPFTNSKQIKLTMDKYITVCGNTESCHYNRKLGDIMNEMLEDGDLDNWNNWSYNLAKWKTIINPDYMLDLEKKVIDLEKKMTDIKYLESKGMKIMNIESKDKCVINGLSKLLLITFIWTLINSLVLSYICKDRK